MEDFLFTYYSHRPAQLRRWHPGRRGRAARTPTRPSSAATTAPAPPGSPSTPTAVRARRGRVDRAGSARCWRRPPARPAALRLLRAARVGDGLPADPGGGAAQRLAAAARPGAAPPRSSRSGASGAATSTRSASSPPPARPLNLLSPTRESQHELRAAGLPARQHGPLQVGVQAVARWCPASWSPTASSWPGTSATLDMRASPYDLAALGYPPVRIETPDGRRRVRRRAARLRRTGRARCASRLCSPPSAASTRRRRVRPSP